MSRIDRWIAVSVVALAVVACAALGSHARLEAERHPSLQGLSPLQQLVAASATGEVEIVRILLSQGVPVDGVADADFMVPDLGGGPGVSIDEGTSALWEAVAWGHWDIVRLLLEHGADPNMADRGGTLPLAMALAGTTGDTTDLSLLFDHGAVFVPRRAGARRGFTIADLWLRSHLVLINKRDRAGRTGLMYVAAACDTGAITTLLDWGADRRLKDNQGRTAYEFLQTGKARGACSNMEQSALDAVSRALRL